MKLVDQQCASPISWHEQEEQQQCTGGFDAKAKAERSLQTAALATPDCSSALNFPSKWHSDFAILLLEPYVINTAS